MARSIKLSGFYLGLHSLWSLPIAILQNGGLAFVLIYILLLVILGAPLLLLEMFLGQYSGMAISGVFRHLSPVMAGLGVAICVQALLRAVMEMGIIMWMGLGMFKLFNQQMISEGMFNKEVFNNENANFEGLGRLGTELLIVLGIASSTVFLLAVA